MDSNLQAWYRGVNPFPRLAMDESWALIQFIDGRSLTDDEHKSSSRLQQKTCGIDQSRPSCCGQTENLRSGLAGGNLIWLCPACAREALSRGE